MAFMAFVEARYAPDGVARKSLITRFNLREEKKLIGQTVPIIACRDRLSSAL
jgi:hypothetical protein